MSLLEVFGDLFALPLQEHVDRLLEGRGDADLGYDGGGQQVAQLADEQAAPELALSFGALGRTDGRMNEVQVEAKD